VTGPTAALVALGYGFASALVPVVNAEVYAAAAGGYEGFTVVAAVIGLAVGQTAGKLTLFEAARRGAGWVARRRAAAHNPGRAGRWAARIPRWLERRRTGLPTVLVSAAVGLPPLAAVSLAAGTSGQRRWEFVAMCALGRLIRFGILALPLALSRS
jgi:membrane protein YqaA with SNARE-associated domain